MEKKNDNLKAMFDEFNEKYFSNSIASDWKVEFTPAKKTYLGITYHHNKLIRITDNMDEFSTTATLLHEMCHAALPKTSGHGKDFKNLVKKVSEMSGIDYESIAGCKDYVLEYKKPVELTNAVVKSIWYSSSDGGYKMQMNVVVKYTKNGFKHIFRVFVPWDEPESFWTADTKAENGAKKAAKNMVCGVLGDIPEPEIKDRSDVRKYYDSVNEMFVKDENGYITAVR